MQNHFLISLKALYHALILIVNWLYLLLKLNFLGVCPLLDFFSLSVVSPGCEYPTLSLKVSVSLRLIHFNLSLNVLDN